MFGFTQYTLFATGDDAFLLFLVDTMVKSSFIFLLVAATAIMLHKSSASMRYLVWGVAFLAFLLLPILSVTIPKWQVLPDWLSARNFTANSEEIAICTLDGPVASNSSDEASRDLSTPLSTALTTLGPKSTEPLVAKTPEQAAPTPSYELLRSSRLVMIVWSIGAGLLLLRIGFSRLMLSRVLSSADQIKDGPIADEVMSVCRQLGIGRQLRVYQSSRRGMCMTWGLLGTFLLLPEEASTWDPRRLRAVLLHELAHVKHYDTITHVVTQLVCAFYWLHPLVWLAAWRLHLERERVCDDLVLRSGVKASDYAEDLLSLLAQRVAPATALALIGRSGLEGRLQAILSEKINRKSMTARVFALALMAGVTSTTAFAMVQAPNQPTSESSAVCNAL